MTLLTPDDGLPIPRSAPPRKRWTTLVLIVVLLLMWLLAIWYRTEIRVVWWTHRITSVESPELRNYYAACLAATGDKAFPSVPTLMTDSRASIRLIGVRTLRSCPQPLSLPLLLLLLSDPSIEVRDAAALEIALRADRVQALPPLRGMMAEPAETATAAMIALQRIGGPVAEGILLNALKTGTDPDAVAQAIESLGMLGCQAAQQAIRDRLNDHRPLTRPPAAQRRAEQAIAAVQGQLLSQGIQPEDLAAAARTELTVAAVAARALASLDSPPVTAPATTTAAS